MKKRILVLLLAALMVFTLCACKVSSTSSSSTTVTTSVTDSEGKTTTNTVTSEAEINLGKGGVSGERDSKPAEEADDANKYEELRADMLNTYSYGLEGRNDDGDLVLFAYDDPDEFSFGQIIIVSADNQSMYARYGEIYWDDDHYVLESTQAQTLIPFQIEDAEEEDAVLFTFLGDGDVVTMYAFSGEDIVDDIINVLSYFDY